MQNIRSTYSGISTSITMDAIDSKVSSGLSVLQLIDSICQEGNEAFADHYNQIHGGIACAIGLFQEAETIISAAHTASIAIHQARRA